MLVRIMLEPWFEMRMHWQGRGLEVHLHMSRIIGCEMVVMAHRLLLFYFGGFVMEIVVEMVVMLYFCGMELLYP